MTDKQTIEAMAVEIIRMSSRMHTGLSANSIVADAPFMAKAAFRVTKAAIRDEVLEEVAVKFDGLHIPADCTSHELGEILRAMKGPKS